MAPADSKAPEDTSRSIALVLGATLVFAFSDACAKLIVGDIPPVEVFWIRSVVSAVLTLAFVLRVKGKGALITKHPLRQLGRGTAVFLSSLLFLNGLIHLPLADNSAINYVWPLMITVLSIIFLREKIGIRRIIATLVGFGAMLIMVRPGSSSFQPAAIFPIGAAFLWAVSSVMTRGMTSDESPETTIVWSALIALIGSSLVVPFFWVTPSLWQIGLGLIIGTGSAVGHAMVIYAFSLTPASTLAPYTYLQLVWAVGFGYLMFKTVPDFWMIVGGVIIALSGIYTAHREHVRKQERTAG